jgi:hypothetical protein
MKNKYKIVYILIITIVLSACRYEEGPFLSFKSKEKRITGLWEIDELKINDLDYLSTYNTDSVYLRFSITYNAGNIYMILVEGNRISPQMATGAVEFTNKGNNLKFQLTPIVSYTAETDPIFSLIPALKEEKEWEINELKNTKFALSLDDDTNSYYIHYFLLDDYDLE